MEIPQGPKYILCLLMDLLGCAVQPLMPRPGITSVNGTSRLTTQDTTDDFLRSATKMYLTVPPCLQLPCPPTPPWHCRTTGNICNAWSQNIHPKHDTWGFVSCNCSFHTRDTFASKMMRYLNPKQRQWQGARGRCALRASATTLEARQW